VHPRHSTRSTGAGVRGPGLPTQRSRRGTHPSGVAWWQPPKPQRYRAQRNGTAGQARGRAGEDTARHRAPDATDVLPVVDAPARAGRTPPQQRRHARRERLLRRALLGVAAAAVLGPVLAFAAGYAAFSVPNPDEAVNNQVTVVSFADGSPLTRLVPEEGNRTKVPIDQPPAPAPPPDEPDVTPDDPGRPGILGDPGVDGPSDDQGCSVTPCG
jgi:hypothetical protein